MEIKSVKDFKNKKVAVLGAGVEGISSAKYLVRHGAKVTILDRKQVGGSLTQIARPARQNQNNSQNQTRSLNEPKNIQSDFSCLANGRAATFDLENVKAVCGNDYLRSLSDCDLIVRSPGVKRDLPELIQAEKRGILITSQTKLFFDLCPCQIIGVTGTKGKGTTCALIYEMLKKEKKDAYLGGNIGQPPFEFLDKLNPHSIVVLELSSFQLLDLTKGPHIAVVLMTTSEHLDYHRDVYEYINAKRNILRFQTESDLAILNKDYPASRESDIETKGKIFWISRGEVEGGCFVKDGKIFLTTKDGCGNEARTMRNQVLSRDSRRRTSPLNETGFLALASKREMIIETKDILLPGEHNLENVCAAVMAATLAGVTKENIVKVLKTFKGLEHRLELVAEINGVKYYDDSFSTTPETAMAAIKAFKQPEILILGGSSKGSDFTELGKLISEEKNIKAIIGIGVEWQRIKAQFKVQPFGFAQGESSKFKVIEGCKNMNEVVRTASRIAQPGDVVVLSPACASFDMFKNYKDRGEQFKREVLNLKS